MRWLVVLALVSACGGPSSPPAAAPAPAKPAAAETPTAEVAPRFGFVLLATPTVPAADAVVAAYGQVAPGAPPLVADGPAEEAVLGFRLDGQPVLVALVSKPIPDGEAEANAKFSLSAMSSGWKPAPHVAHLIVVLRADDRKALDAMRDFTRALAAVTVASDAVGVYLGSAGATHEPRFFVDAVRDLETPVVVWSGISVAGDGPGRGTLLSLGMHQLGLPELLLGTSQAGAGDAIEYFFDLLLYVAERGEPIPEGDTIGRTADEKLPVRYQPSPVDATQQVWRVDLP